MFLGRVVGDDPLWLPEDRDVVDMVLDEQAQRLSCGHWKWQEPEVQGLEPGYKACGICKVGVPYENKIADLNRERATYGQEEFGLTFGWFPPREDTDGD